MKWRSALAATVGLLLVIPLALTVRLMMRDEAVDRLPGGATVSPVLSQEDRARLMTFHRDCTRSEDCEPPLGCRKHWKLRKALCADSECATDLQCAKGETCQVVPSEGNGPRLRLCVQQGARQEGEACELFPGSSQQACGPELLCREGRCGRACQQSEPSSCPRGFFCSDSPEGSVCLPTCQEQGCPEGQQCLRFNRVGDRSVSACVRVRGENCQETPCAPGQACRVLQVPERPGEAHVSCVIPCGPGRPSCPEGLICPRFFCVKPCDPQAEGSCGPDSECRQLGPKDPWACRPLL